MAKTEKIKIRTAYDDDYIDPGINFVDPHTGEVEKSLTDQSQADDCDINLLMKRYEKSGVIVTNSQSPSFGDVSDLKSFQEAQNIFIEANKAFMSLDAKVRKEFDNDPAKFLDHMDKVNDGDKDAIAEAVRLGIMPLREEATTPVPDEKSEA